MNILLNRNSRAINPLFENLILILSQKKKIFLNQSYMSLIKACNISPFSQSPKTIVSKTKPSDDSASPSIPSPTSNFLRPKRVDGFSIDLEFSSKGSPKMLTEEASFRNTKTSFGLSSDKSPVKMTEFSLFSSPRSFNHENSYIKQLVTSRSNWKSSNRKPDAPSLLRLQKPFAKNQVNTIVATPTTASETPYIQLLVTNSPTNKHDSGLKFGANGFGNETALSFGSHLLQSPINSPMNYIKGTSAIIRQDFAKSPMEKKKKGFIIKHKSEKRVFLKTTTKLKPNLDDCLKPVISAKSKAMFAGTEIFLQRCKLLKFK